tara:strand:+ start:210 stop:596 length:387 start_codon:yes stop_codon:yes gene_type:complete
LWVLALGSSALSEVEVLNRLYGAEEFLPDEAGDDADEGGYWATKYESYKRRFGGCFAFRPADYSGNYEQQRAQYEDDAGDTDYGWAKHAGAAGSIELVDLVWVLARVAVRDVHPACVWLCDHRDDATV